MPQGVKAKQQRFWRTACTGRKYGCFGEVRGMGLLIGAALTAEYAGKAKDFMNAAADAGLMMIPQAGPGYVRFAPSLLIADADIDAAMALLETAIRKVTGK